MEKTKRPQKVLLVITKSNWGGAQKYVYDVARLLAERKFDVIVATGGEGELVPRLKGAGIRVRRMRHIKNNMNPFGSVLGFFELISLYRTERPDVVHLNSSKAGLFGAVAGRVVGIRKIIFTAHGWPFNEDRPALQKTFLKVLMQLTAVCSHVTICVSNKTLQDLAPAAFIAKKCVVIYNGIEKIPFKHHTAFYEEMHIMRHERVAVVSIGELHPSKGFDLALSYLKDLQEISWEWFILGEGSARSQLGTMIKKYNLSDRVHLMGHVSDAAAYLRSFDLFFLPSRTEAMAYVAIEALQSDLPILASKVGGIPEVLGRDRGTTFIDMRNPKTKQSLEKALSASPRAGPHYDREALRAEFSLDHMVSRIIETYS
jgi:glycosyltransferase involved in cell wall biosynthesis